MGEQMNVRKLAKVLAMTTSASDGEALVAARKAAAMVDQAGLTYDTLFSEYLPNHYDAAANGAWIDENKQSWLVRALIRKLRNEIAELRQQTESRDKPANDDAASLKQRLLTTAPLNNWERNTLSQIGTIPPKSKEEYYILWLARRYRLRA